MRRDRPHMPGYGIEPGPAGQLEWDWARQRLTDSHNYWLATADAAGEPHLAVVWGVWFDDGFYFSTGALSRKGRNLLARPQCSIATESGAEAIVVRGRAEPTDSPPAPTKAYKAKYGMGFPEALWLVRPQTVIAMIEAEFATAATRWTFDPPA